MITQLDRDAANRTRADLLGLALTIAAVAVGGVLSGDWILFPAGYWALILTLRLAAIPRERRAVERNEHGVPRSTPPPAGAGGSA
jgi:hypothetical protein